MKNCCRQTIPTTTLFAVLLLVACGDQPLPDRVSTKPSNESDTAFVGSRACQTCHQAAFREWQSSHHQVAMQVATPATVLGDFSDAVFDNRSTRAEFRRDGERFVVRTENASGSIQDFEVTHTFGIEPLQQYLVDFPGGRKQALPFLWDTRKPEDGGQRWFHLYPDETIEPGDELHWTGTNFNWNVSCAECHSTHLEPGYDLATDEFATTWSEISVGCEACHGPGRQHLRQAEQGNFDVSLGLQLTLDDHEGAVWIMDAGTGMASRSAARTTLTRQPEACGRCHARRAVIAPTYAFGQVLSATHMPALLDDGLYFPNGQIRDEVYVYGSFLQSKMYQAGVTCSDCHNPHSGDLKTGTDPDDVCSQCHLPTRFRSRDHYGDASDTTRCVDCHMTARVYMGVDERRDHFFRIPTDETLRTKAFAADRNTAVDDDLIHLLNTPDVPSIVRATALTRLDQGQSAASTSAIQSALGSPDPLVRIGALRALQNLPAAVRSADGLILLSDPVRSVRHQAALTYADGADLFDANTNKAFRIAADEIRETHRHSGSLAESNVILGDFESTVGRYKDAAAWYRRAIQLNPSYPPAYVNFADALRRSGDLEGAETVAREGIQQIPDSAALHHSLGLLIATSDDTTGALFALERATKLDPDSVRYIYVLAIAQNSYGTKDQALETITVAYKKFAHDFDTGWALATMLRDAGKTAAAYEVALELQNKFPDDRRVSVLLETLR